MTTPLDLSDVPPVSARELSVAVKLLTLHGGALATAHTMTDDALRNVFAAYWQLVARDAARKTATLVRLQHLIAVCASRRLQGLLADHGGRGVAEALNGAATCRLNVAYGINPMKLARAMHSALNSPVAAERAA